MRDSSLEGKQDITFNEEKYQILRKEFYCLIIQLFHLTSFRVLHTGMASALSEKYSCFIKNIAEGNKNDARIKTIWVSNTGNKENKG